MGVKKILQQEGEMPRTVHDHMLEELYLMVGQEVLKVFKYLFLTHDRKQKSLPRGEDLFIKM